MVERLRLGDMAKVRVRVRVRFRVRVRVLPAVLLPGTLGLARTLSLP